MVNHECHIVTSMEKITKQINDIPNLGKINLHNDPYVSNKGFYQLQITRTLVSQVSIVNNNDD